MPLSHGASCTHSLSDYVAIKTASQQRPAHCCGFNGYYDASEKALLPRRDERMHFKCAQFPINVCIVCWAKPRLANLYAKTVVHFHEMIYECRNNVLETFRACVWYWMDVPHQKCHCFHDSAKKTRASMAQSEMTAPQQERNGHFLLTLCMSACDRLTFKCIQIVIKVDW